MYDTQEEPPVPHSYTRATTRNEKRKRKGQWERERERGKRGKLVLQERVMREFILLDSSSSCSLPIFLSPSPLPVFSCISLVHPYMWLSCRWSSDHCIHSNGRIIYRVTSFPASGALLSFTLLAFPFFAALSSPAAGVNFLQTATLVSASLNSSLILLSRLTLHTKYKIREATTLRETCRSMDQWSEK